MSADTVTQLPNPVCGNAGWGVVDPDNDAAWLSDGYSCWEDAMTAAHMAYVYTRRDGMLAQQAQVLAASAMQDSELGEYSDYSKDCTGARVRTVAGLRLYRAQAWGEQYDEVRAQQGTVPADAPAYACAECGHLHWHGARYGYSTCPIEGCGCQGQA